MQALDQSLVRETESVLDAFDVNVTSVCAGLGQPLTVRTLLSIFVQKIFVRRP